MEIYGTDVNFEQFESALTVLWHKKTSLIFCDDTL